MMRKLLLLLLIALAACQPPPPVLPTLVVLATLPPPTTATPTVSPTATEIAALPTDTAVATPTDEPTATGTPAPTFTPPPTLTDTPLPTVTRTPSLTITNTNTRPPTSTFTATVELSGIESLGELAGRTTLLPPEQLYNAPTLTAFHIAEQTLIAGREIIVTYPAGGFPTSAPGNLGTAAAPPVICAIPPPAALSALFAADTTLQNQIGCPLGITATQSGSAAQLFERGMMVYLAGNPGTIYSLANDGTFRRFNDTFAAGVDPDSGGETPPVGYLEPVRGFGKVWRTNPDVRLALGWAIIPEAGDTASLLAFERGRALYLPQRGMTVVLIDDFGGMSGRWRSFGGSF